MLRTNFALFRFIIAIFRPKRVVLDIKTKQTVGAKPKYSCLSLLKLIVAACET